MPMSLSDCAALLRGAGIRHHVDPEAETIRVLMLTGRYTSPRAERLAIVGIATPDEGRRCRVAIAHAFAAGRDPAATCLAACRLAAATPLAAVEYDAVRRTIAIVSEIPIADGTLTADQLLAALEGVVLAAEAWHEPLAASAGPAGRQSPRRRGRRGDTGRAA